MDTITLFQWGADGVLAGSIQADPMAGIPERSTPTAPPKVKAGTVVVWTGSCWAVTDKAPEPPSPSKTEQLAAIAAKRFTVETGGITVQGLPIDTSRDSQNLITGAALAADRDPAYSVKWKTAAGFVELSATQLLALADAVRKHVQACFNREADLAKAVDDGTYQTAMLEQGWPV
ncbi:DUF4376 domain-containing protein [uncultured Pseudomonas sp.]|uniref:DUF4376 domain-containing protein n=1 Tax=uncultured Pseudomonas sp. TaxID=114707 RepID=UPI00258B07B4|nr:DUF4376 domain-containing protein [uncultured Pseudomonas sp.]